MMLIVDDEIHGDRRPLSYHGRTITGTEAEMHQAAGWMKNLNPEIVPHDGTSPLAFISWICLEHERTEQARWAEIDAWERREMARFAREERSW